MALPQLTEEQRTAALEKAAAARRTRAELKDRLKRGGTTLDEVLKQSDNDEVLGKMKAMVREAVRGEVQRQGQKASPAVSTKDAEIAAAWRQHRPQELLV